MSTILDNFFGKKTGHPALFQELCKYHDLDKKTCKVLNHIVAELKLEKPGMIFIDPSILRAGIKIPDMAESVEMLRELYYRWFGGAI